MNKQLSYAPVKLGLSYCGSATPGMKAMSSLLSQQICLLCYDEGKTIKELSESLETNPIYIKDCIENLCQLGLMKREQVPENDDIFMTLFPMIHNNISQKMYMIRNNFLLENDIPKKINDILKLCENKIKSVDFYGNDLPLEYLNWFLYVVIDNLIDDKVRNYYTDKTDEYLISSKFYGTQKRDFSVIAFYLYPDEKDESNESEKCWNHHSTYYNKVGSYYVNNVMDAEPFPYGWEDGTYTVNGGRNSYLCNENISTYLKIIKADMNGEKLNDFTDVEKKVIEEFIEHGVIKELDGRYKGLIPYFTQDSFKKLKQIISKEITPIAKLLAENLGGIIEEELLPSMKGIKDRINQFYIFWIVAFTTPLMNLWWYGMNEGGLEIPEDYSKSAAAIYIVED